MRLVVALGLAVVALLTSCAPGRGNSSTECLCDSRFAITIEPSKARFAPDTYLFEITSDGVRTSEECMVAEPPRGAICDRNITPLMKDFEVIGFEVRAPAAKSISLTMRAGCATRILAEKTFEPTYGRSDCGCRTAAVTITADDIGSAFTICPDAGVD